MEIVVDAIIDGKEPIHMDKHKIELEKATDSHKKAVLEL